MILRLTTLLTTALVASLIGLALVFDLRADGGFFEVVAVLAIGSPFAILGGLVTRTQPRQPIGWLMLALGACLAFAVALNAAVRWMLATNRSRGGAEWLGLGGSTFLTAFFLLLLATVLLLPNGKLLSRRWRVVMGGVIVLGLTQVVALFAPGTLDNWDEGLRNPLGIDALAGVIDVLDAVLGVVLLGLIVVVLGSLVLRFRRARGVERAQLRWVLAGILGTFTSWVGLFVLDLAVASNAVVDQSWAIAVLSLALIPIGIGLAVLRYRLYEVDRIVSRALTYGLLTMLLASAYVALVLAAQAAFASLAGGSDLAIAVSTLVVAALFLPLRSRVQGFVDRRFYRRRYDAQRTLEAFGARLREQVELDVLGSELLGVVGETMQPAHVSVWLRETVR